MRLKLAAIALVALAACDKSFFVEPAPAPAVIAVNYSLSSMDASEAFDKADRAHVSVTGHGISIDTVLAFSPAGEVRLRLVIAELDSVSTVVVGIEILRGTQALFEGSTTATLTPGQTTEVEIKTLESIPAAVQLPPGIPALTGVGDTVTVTATVAFATGDAITGLTPTYSSTDTTVVKVSSTGRITAVGPGQAQIRATFGSLTSNMTVNVTFPSQLRVCSTPSGTIRTYSTLAAAVQNVAGNGTIRICNGSHNAVGVIIGRPMTIEPEAGAAATLTGNGTDNSIQIQHAAGMVILRGLTFTNHGMALIAGGTYGNILLENSTFVTPAGMHTFQFNTLDATSLTTVTVRNIQVTGGVTGAFFSGPIHINVEDSRFDGQTFSNIQVQNLTNGNVLRNTINECGQNGCIRVRFAGTLAVNDNVMRSTKRTGVVAVVTAGLVIGGANVRAERNTIEGLGTVSNPTDENSYPIISGISVMGGNTDAGGAHLVANTVRNTSYGIVAVKNVSGPANHANGNNNIVQGVAIGVISSGGSTLDLHQNDFTNYVHAIEFFDPSPGFTLAPGSLTCNWWGTSNGPQNISGPVATNVYTPFATSPIAGTGRTC